MKRIIAYQYNPFTRVREAIGLHFLSDDVSRFLSSNTALAFSTLDAKWSGLSARTVSSSVMKMMNILKGSPVNQSMDGAYVKSTVDSKVTKIREIGSTIESLSRWNDVEVEITKVNADISLNADEKKTMTSNLKSTQVSADAIASQMWIESKILEYLSLQQTLKDDMSDNMNDGLMSSLLREDSLFSTRWSAFENDNYKTYRITSGAPVSFTNADPYNFENLFLGTEVKQYAPQASAPDISLSHILTFLGRGTATNGAVVAQDFLTDMVTRLTDLELCNLVNDLPSILPGLEKVTNAKLSDNKMINIVMTEAERVYKLYEAQLFINAQAWVGLLSLNLQTYYHDHLIDDFIEAHPSLAATFDIKGILTTLTALPIGKSTAKLLANAYPIKDFKVKKTIYTGYPVNKDVDTSQGYIKLFAEMRHAIPQLYSLTKNAAFLSGYRNGAAHVGSAVVTIPKYNFDCADVPLTFTQFGSLAGTAIKNFGDYTWGMFIDWGINRFNSSMMTEVVRQEADSEVTIAPLVYGSIKYHDYATGTIPANIKDLFGVGKPCTGIDFSGKSIPLLMIKRAIPPNWINRYFIDGAYTSWGPVSALPLPPINPLGIKSGYSLASVSKQVIGKYENTTDALPLEFFHVKDIYQDSVDAKETTLSEVLGISKAYLKRDKAIPTIIRRFVAAANKNEVIICPFITKDSFFTSSIGSIYYVPYYDGAIEARILYLGYNQSSDADGSLIHDIKMEPVRMSKILTSERTAITSPMVKRIITTPLDLRTILSAPSNAERKPFDLTKAISA